MFKIYKLYHPLSNKIYIGKTSDIEKRLNTHLTDKRRNKRTSWIKSLKSKYGQAPLVEVVHDNIENEDWANSYERSWISYYRNNYGNKNVLNMTDGGDGQCGLKFSSASRKKMSESQRRLHANGYVHPMLGKHHTQNTRQRLSKLNIGHAPNITSFKVGSIPVNRKLGNIDVIHIRKMQKAGSSLRFIAKKFKIDRSTVTNIVRNRTYKEVPV